MSLRDRSLVAAIVVLCVLPISTYALVIEQTQPATTNLAPGGSLQVQITDVQGQVQYRDTDSQPWQFATKGMILGENAELRTGPRSAVRFVIPPDQIITVDRLGVVKILEAIQQGNKVTTRLGMKYGRTRYDIETAGLEHDATISSPSATLALRGTDMVMTDQRPFPAQVVRLTGQAQFRDFKKSVTFGAKGKGHTVVNSQKNSAAEVSLAQSVIDPTIALARSQAEATLVASLLNNGATVEYDYQRGIKVVRGGQPPTMDAELVPVLPGRLNFVMRWTGNTDLNLAVRSPEAGLNGLYPFASMDTLASGGHMDFNHVGGAHGGIEIASWPGGPVPAGTYVVGAVYVSGAITPATMDVFLDGKRLPIRTAEGSVTTANFTGEPINPEFGAGILVGTVDITDDQAGVPIQSARKASKRKPPTMGPIAPLKATSLRHRK
jgi:hypothetical protein